MHPMLTGLPSLNRRTVLQGLGAAIGLGYCDLAHAAVATSNRLVIINIKGGLDGLSLVAPYGDPYLAGLRASLMAPGVGKSGGMLDLGGFFGLHPAMQNFYQMYRLGEALAVHAVGNAGSSRSHFEGQDYLQSGEPLLLSSGWVNRISGYVPMAPRGLQSIVNIGLDVPLLVEGPSVTAGWTPQVFPSLSASLMSSMTALNAPDPLLGPAIAVSFSDSSLMKSILISGSPMPTALSPNAALAWRAGELLAAADGPRIATLELDSVDTHDDQVNRLNSQLPDVDAVFGALKASMGAAWKSTVVLTMTEFGRTAAANGTGGTDHGTGFAVLMAGGAVAGGQVVATWPGLAPGQLYQGRDVQATLDFRSVAATVLSKHMGVSTTGLSQAFPAGYGALISNLLR